MALGRILSFFLRLAELVFACIVAGVTGHFLHNSLFKDHGRLIYTEVVAAISIFLAIIWLVPFSGSFIHWPVDLVISLCWFAAFGLLVNFLRGNNCGSAFNWQNVSLDHDPCGKWKADIAFSFLSAIFWLVSTIIGLYWVHHHNGTETPSGNRRRWYHSRV